MKLETKILLLEEENKTLKLQNEQLLAQYNKTSEVTNKHKEVLAEVHNIVYKQGRFGRFTKLKALLNK